MRAIRPTKRLTATGELNMLERRLLTPLTQTPVSFNRLARFCSRQWVSTCSQ